MLINISTLILGLTCFFSFSSAVGTLTSNPLSTNGVVTVCQGAPLSFVCSHDNVAGAVTRYVVSGPSIMRCQGAAVHNSDPVDTVCGPFSIIMVSDGSGTTVSATAQTIVTETLDGAMVECFDGAGDASASVGVVTIQVVDPTPFTNPVTYSVGSSVSGNLTINVNSPGAYGTGVTYSGSVVGGSGSLQVNGNVLSVTGLDYTQDHTVNITGASDVCSVLVRSSQFSYTFNTAELNINRLIPSISCSIPFLPVTLEWDINQETLSSTNSTISLNPPMTRPLMISFTSESGNMGTASSSVSPFILTNLTVGSDYNFTVSVVNVAGSASSTTSLAVSAFSVNTSTVATQGCLTFTVSENCAEDISSGDFTILLLYGVGRCQSVAEFPSPTRMTVTINLSTGVCIPVETMKFVELCYTATLMYQNTAVMSQTNLDFRRCEVSTLESQLGSGVTFTLSNAPDSNGTLPHTTITTLDCGSGALTFSGVSQALCVDSVWTVGNNSCSIAVWAIAVIIIVVLVVVTVIIVIVFVLYLKLKNKESSSKPVHVDVESDGLTKTPPPPDSLYADPNTIEHEAAPGTEDQYAMVDRKVKKNTKPKPTPPEALYQDPNTIEHETTASGDTYAVVDKPKRSSKKKGGPDVVPPANEGLTYADIDLSSKRPKPGSGRQAPQQPGEYPKEHPVEYSSVNHGNTSQL